MSNILILIVNTITALLTGALLLRFWMQVVRVRPPNSLGQFIFQITDWLVLPLRRVVPAGRGYDWASLIAAILVTMASAAIELGIRSAFSAQALFLLTLLHTVQWICYGLIALLIIEAIFSWVNPHAPLAPFVRALNEPLLGPLRKIVPLVGGIDLSPLVALLMLQIVLYVAESLIRMA